MPNETQTDPKIEIEKNPNPNDSRKGKEDFTASSYLAALKKQKENSVPKEEYEHLKAEHETLVKGLADGTAKQQVNVDTSTKEIPMKDLISKVLDDKNMLNLDYVKTALEIRKRKLESGKPDPFAPLGYKRPTTRDEAETAERVANELQDCVDRCNNNPQIFNDLLRTKLR